MHDLKRRSAFFWFNSPPFRLPWEEALQGKCAGLLVLAVRRIA
jgi:hypothetical protein